MKARTSFNLRRRELIYGLIFVAPFAVGFLGLTLYPMLSSLYYSFTSYNMRRDPVWLGLGNYIKMFTGDRHFWLSLRNTIYFVLVGVPLRLGVALVIAFLLNIRGFKGVSFYRAAVFVPTVVPMVAASILFVWIYNPQYGALNGILSFFGIVGPNWLGNPKLVKFSLILLAVWGSGRQIVIYLAGLQDVPSELYEAAMIDGAGALARIFRVTIPLIAHVIFYTVIIEMIAAFQYFTQAFIMTNGGPMNASLFYPLYLYQNGFEYYRMGYASALAWFLFVIIVLCTVLLFRVSRRYSHYER